ncbi:WecB/TagA/CpsF family glycosyltransferase [Acutalibacter muris]|uniref:Glycosyltransferase n=1 Tax=Acutalibacter muris TaxID=1796620 RepID=A0A1Z2XMB1_9FIRM|nr:WecB/TagA/CpsF family glycosyltransferase [Acutalibacter muris]ANU53747.1 glycosyltransferase [Hungateiclostridiaceae bacterium KB18]ASB39579.1 glycosyltransferase [Acutalibacter muris]MCI9192634.1 WecB/TagA/CpsF family glycosyltransferase [Acutalibacter muris]QQR28870.1 WecB/TagA/CpsF family glycosyltransferase [Acutalibacter muris]
MAVNEYLKRVYGGSARSYFERAEKALLSGERLFTVTANPEIIMHADRDPKIKKLLLSPDAEIIPDGISVVKAMNTLGCEASERITGVDLAAHLLKAAGENGKSVYLLGAKEEVVSALAEKLRAEHPDITVNYHNGYDGDKDVIFDEIAALAPDLVLVGLGVPAQELLIYRHLPKFTRGVLVGVGGSFDVLSGSKKRAPQFFVKTNTEWLYRIAKEPQRLGRFWNNNVKFLREVRKARP